MQTPAIGTSQPQRLKGDNPFSVDVNHYCRNATPEYHNLLWSETHLWSVWNPNQGVGLFVHAGTTPEDPDLWWAQVFAYLPDGWAVADRSWGRASDRRGPTTGNFRATSEYLGHFKLCFDGAGERVSGVDMASRLVGAGPALPFQFEVELTPAMPVWDLFKASAIGESEWASTHHEQVHISRGWLKVAGDRGGHWGLDGVSFRDHSIGARDVTRVGGDVFFGAYFPESGRSIQGLIAWDNTNQVALRSGSVWENGELELIDELGMTGVEVGADQPTSLHGLSGEPKNFELTLKRLNGETVVLTGEVLHTINICNLSPNTNLNGTPIDLPGDPLVGAECQVKLTWPGGEVGHGHFERGCRLSLLQHRPTGSTVS